MVALLFLAAGLAVSNMIHLARREVRSSLIGRASGLIVVYGAYVLATPWFGLHQGRLLVLLRCRSPFMLATVVLSARGRLVSVTKSPGDTTFLAAAIPLLGMLWLSVLASIHWSPAP